MQLPVIKKPLVPQLVHDENTRLIIVIVSLILCIIAIIRILKYYNKP